MRRRTVTLALIVMTAAGFVAGLLIASKMQRVQAQAKLYLYPGTMNTDSNITRELLA